MSKKPDVTAEDVQRLSAELPRIFDRLDEIERQVESLITFARAISVEQDAARGEPE